MGVLTDIAEGGMAATATIRSQLPPFTAVTAVPYFVGFVVLSVVLNVLQQLLYKRSDRPPVVFHYFPFFGSAIVYGMDPYAFFFANQKKYGDCFTFILFGSKMTVALGPKGNDLILNGKLSEVNAEKAYTGLTTPVFGKDVVYDVPNHVLIEQKKFIKFGLTTEAFKTYVPLIVEQVKNYFAKNPAFKGTSGSVSLLKIIPEITIFTASRTLQGKEVRDKLDGTFADLFHDLDMGFQPLNFMFPWIPFPHNRKRDAAHKAIADTYKALIKKRRENPDPNQEPDMLTNLMNRSYKDGRPLNDTEVAHIMIALLMAGQHTSMATSAWALLHLAAEPQFVDQLYAEQQKIYGNPDGTLRDLTYEGVMESHFLLNVIKEVLRIHPPLHSILRKVESNMRVPDTNYIIPPTHYVLAAPGASAIDARYFPEPLAFKPQRWDASENQNYEGGEKVDFGFGVVTKGTASPYLPFGAGRHRCVGEQFANVQLGTILSTFIREYKLKNPSGRIGVPPADYTSMIAGPQPPAEILWEKRQ